ncbi:hypothetical protein JXL19_06945 [bacterium]|nr:hypothetical protein [bacterium]
MGALWAVLGGVIAVCLGIIGIIFWWSFFLHLLAGTLPVLFIFGGCIALFIGFTEIRDSLKSKEEDKDFSSFKAESDLDEKPEDDETKTDDTKGKSGKTPKK